jgi:hypothetical protein
VEVIGGFFIALGVLLFLLTLGLAFTTYGIIAAFLGVASFSVGIWMLARRPDRKANGDS